MCRIQCDILIFILQSVLSFYIIFCTFLSFKRKQKNKGIAWYIRKITTFFKSNGFVVHCLVIILDGPKKILGQTQQVERQIIPMSLYEKIPPTL